MSSNLVGGVKVGLSGLAGQIEGDGQCGLDGCHVAADAVDDGFDLAEVSGDAVLFGFEEVEWYGASQVGSHQCGAFIVQGGSAFGGVFELGSGVLVAAGQFLGDFAAQGLHLVVVERDASPEVFDLGFEPVGSATRLGQRNWLTWFDVILMI
jgi:hypothetical protein